MSNTDHEDEEPVSEFVPNSEKEKLMLINKLTEEQYNDWIKNGTLLPPLDRSHLQPIPKKRLRHLYIQQLANQERREQIDNRQMDHYKAYVMLVFNLSTDEEYKKWVLEGNKPPPELRPEGMELTTYGNRVRHALGLIRAQWSQKLEDGNTLAALEHLYT